MSGNPRGRGAEDPAAGTPLETLPPASPARPPGADMGDLTPIADVLSVPPGHPPRVRIVTIERDELDTPPADSGGADPLRPIGRGNPPRAGQQRSGAPSKNPRGRPPGTSNPERFSRFLHTKITVRRGGSEMRLSRIERLMQVIAQEGADGDRAARRLMERILHDEAIRSDHRAQNERAAAQKAEQAGMGARQKLELLIHQAHSADLDLVRRLQDRGILERGSLEIAGWMRALIEQRRA